MEYMGFEIPRRLSFLSRVFRMQTPNSPIPEAGYFFIETVKSSSAFFSSIFIYSCDCPAKMDSNDTLKMLYLEVNVVLKSLHFA